MQIAGKNGVPVIRPYSGGIKRAVYLVYPHAGGTFSVFTTLRAALSSLAINLEWIGVSNQPERIRNDSQFAAAESCGSLIDSRGKSNAQSTLEMLRAIKEASYDLVVVNVLTSPAEMSVPAYLPAHVRRMMLVHSITPGTYDGARAVAPYVHAAVGVSPRIQEELKRKINMPPEFIFAAPNAIDLSPYRQLHRAPGNKTFRIVYLGRISDVDKGVLWLPRIFRQLMDLPIHLTVAGDGGDLAALKHKFAAMASRVTFLGRVDSTQVPALLSQHDALIMPSRFEGLPYTLIEAMAAGCVPVASIIRGSTDFVLKQDVTGLLFPTGDTVAAAASLRRLATDPALCRRLSAAGKEDVQHRFSLDALTRYYLPILESLENARPVPSLNSDSIRMLPIRGAWRRFIPRPMKNYFRARLLR